MMAKTGMLIITNPSRLNLLIPRIKSEIKNTLYIQLYSQKKFVNNALPKNSKLSQTTFYSSSIINLYKRFIDFKKLDIRILLSTMNNPNIKKISTRKPVDVVYFDEAMNNDEMQDFVSTRLENTTKNCQTVALGEIDIESVSCHQEESSTQQMDTYSFVVIGGTFDRLHIGHKILLSEAILRCKKKLTVGITDINMLKTKKLWELIEPCGLRISKVRDFLEDVEPNLEYDVICINDMYGPTKDEPTFQMIVVSAETAGGGKKINELRVSNGFEPLKVHSVELIPDAKQDEEEEDKISSSNDRLRLLGTRISIPKPRSELCPLPYIIGLTGGIASGKSSVCERLSDLGAGIVNCDRIAHELYTSGTAIHSKLIQLFGPNIVENNGEINRKVLGEIVFDDKDKLGKLNNLLWPAILDRSKVLADELHSKGHNIVVLEAAVLIQAGWAKHCHEIWTCIIPPEEAVKRLGDRNGLTEKEARSRLAAQPTNVELVQNAHVVFCTLWRKEYTHKQVERAWNGLKDIQTSENPISKIRVDETKTDLEN